MTGLKADLHSHTIYSDGSFTVGESLDYAKKIGLTHFAITDHDIFMGADEGYELAHKTDIGLSLIYGIELSAKINNESIHILGYFPGIVKDLGDVIRKQVKERKERAEVVLGLLKEKIGLVIDRSEIDKYYSITRKTIGDIVAKNTEYSFDYVMENMIGRGCPCYVPSNKMTIPSAIRHIKDNGGLAVLAHPCIVKNTAPEELLKYGFDGIEAGYPYPKNDESHFRKLAYEKGLLVTAGSDFHSFDDTSDEHGKIGTCTIVDSDVERFLEALYK